MTPNVIAPLQVKGVVVTEKGVTKEFDLSFSEIDIKMPLDSLREYLTQKNLVLVGKQNSNFRNKFEYKVPFISESDWRLEDILVPTDGTSESDRSFTFFIDKDLAKPGFPEIIRDLNIAGGCRKNKNGTIISANRSAFRIKNPHLMEVIIHQNIEEIEENNKEGFLVYCEKGTIRLLPEDLEATKEYVEAIETALSKSNIKKALNKVGRDYGFFWPKKIKLGGIFQINDEQTDIIEQLEKLDHFNNWKIIERNDLTSLCKLLPKKLISRIQEVRGMKILNHSKLPVHMPKGHNIAFHHIPKPLDIPTFNNVKIFASVIVSNKAIPHRNAFVVRVEYLDDENPYIVINRIGRAKKPFDLFIPYMLIGYAEELSIEKFSDNAIAHVFTKQFVSNGMLEVNCVVFTNKIPYFDVVRSAEYSYLVGDVLIKGSINYEIHDLKKDHEEKKLSNLPSILEKVLKLNHSL
ncbi:6522_t:CDS:2, partial [Dentiscutata heterogama]